MSSADLAAAPNAHLARRLAAILYDSLLVIGLWFLASFIAVIALDGPVPAGSIWYELLLWALAALFYVYFWTRTGQTLGMQSWKLHLIDEAGNRVAFGRGALRCLAASLSALVLGLGYLWVLLPDHRAWHDRLTRTRVVFKKS